MTGLVVRKLKPRANRARRGLMDRNSKASHFKERCGERGDDRSTKRYYLRVTTFAGTSV